MAVEYVAHTIQGIGRIGVVHQGGFATAASFRGADGAITSVSFEPPVPRAEAEAHMLRLAGYGERPPGATVSMAEDPFPPWPSEDAAGAREWLSTLIERCASSGLVGPDGPGVSRLRELLGRSPCPPQLVLAHAEGMLAEVGRGIGVGDRAWTHTQGAGHHAFWYMAVAALLRWRVVGDWPPLPVLGAMMPEHCVRHLRDLARGYLVEAAVLPPEAVEGRSEGW